MCRNGLFADAPSFQLAEIIGDGRAYFLSDMNGCPEATDCRTTNQPYVLPGDIVVLSKLRLGHACAFFPNDVGGSAGYIAYDRLRLIEATQVPAFATWQGSWSDGPSAMITISGVDDNPLLAGIAYWPGRPDQHDHPMINMGELDGRLRIFGNRARYDEGECTVDFTLLGEFLMASDNRRCGGLNVTFTGVYRQNGDSE